MGLARGFVPHRRVLLPAGHLGKDDHLIPLRVHRGDQADGHPLAYRERDGSGGGFDIYGLINGLIGAYSGIRAAGAHNKAVKATAERLGEARKAASAENFASLVARLQPLFRELVASGLGPQFQQTLATQIAKSGLTGSGVGNALKGMGSAMPGIFALQSAFGEAGRIQEGQIGVELGFPMPSPKADPFSEALVRGATAYFATVSGAREKEATTPPSERELFPSLSPTNTSGRRY